MFEIELEGGKYRVVLDSDGYLSADRYGEAWRDLTGDKLILALCQRIRELEETK